jgi:uncharacterized membrane protein
MFAHINPTLIYAFWGLLLVSAVAGIFACTGSFVSPYRRQWFLVAGAISLVAGVWIAHAAVQDGALRHISWFTFVSVIPAFLGGVAIARWCFLKNEKRA